MVKKRILVGLTALVATFSLGAEAKLFKWVDDQGVTHYGEVVPPEYANKEQKQIEKGHEVQKQESTKAAKHVDTPEEIEQKRHDAALLGTFTSEAEIDLARDRNLQQVNAHLNGVEMRLKSAQANVDDLQKEKDALVKAGKPVDRGLQEQLDQAQTKLAKLQDEHAKTEADAATIKARYDADKKRFRELKGITN